MSIKNSIKLIALSLVMINASKAISVSYDFLNITNNGSQDIASQLLLTVSAANATSTTVDFKFTNNVGIASNVTEIYFNAANLGTATVTQFGTDFSTSYSLNPGNVPSGNTLTPSFVTSWGLDSANGNAKGINSATDWLNISFVLNTNFYADYSAVIAAINNPDSSGNIRFGLHVRSIGTGGNSDSFVNDVPPPSQVPDSSTTTILLGLGLVTLGLIRRKA
jgi:hypothetical protein